MGRVRATFRNAVALAVGVAVVLMIPSAGAVASTAVREVQYRGLSLLVPASWPVFRLTAGSRTCVRFNRHAVYLGTPSPDQACPANALGRTEAILLQPGHESQATAVDASATLGGELHLVRHAVAVTATWGRDPELVQRALGLASLGPKTSGHSLGLGSVSVRTHAARVRSSSSADAASTSESGHAGRSTYTGLAFDTCSPPSSSQLSAWKHSPYRGMGVYIGGANAACVQPSLDSSWISSVTGAGWHLLLIYVGLQAPRNSCGCAAIHPASAAAEGSAAADDAASRAAALGVGRGSPIYFDMEGYTETHRIRSAVLTFLAAWTLELHHDGYRSGVYSSADSGIADLVSRYGSGYVEPDDLWFAAWDGQASTSASYIPSNEWANHQRAHQYMGPHNLKHGHLEWNVDSDFVDADTVAAHSTGRHSGSPGPRKRPHPKPPGKRHRHHHHSRWPRPTPQPAGQTANGALVEVRGTHTVYRIVGGAPVLVKHLEDIGGPQPVRQISRRRFQGLRAVPAGGSLVYTATGATYRIAGGFPFVLNRPGNRRAGAQLIDVWDINHLRDPEVHLHAVPSNGTVIRAAPSGGLWAFENGQRFPARHSAEAIPVPDTDLGPWPRGCAQSDGHSGGTGVGASCASGNGSSSGSSTGGGGVVAAL